MEIVSTKDKQQQAAIPYFKGFLDQIRANSDKAEQILDGIGYIEGKAEAVREKLEHDFYAAVMAQRDAIVSGNDEDQRLADEVSLLAFSEGRNNQYLPAHEYPKQMRGRGYVSGNELKVLQAQKMLTTLHSIIEDPFEDDEDKAEASLRIDAVNRYIDTTPLAEIMNTDDDGKNDGGNIISKNTDKLTTFGRRVVAAVGLSALALIGTANTSHAAQKSSIDDESYDPNDSANQKHRRFAAPIKLAAPVDGKIEPPVRVEASPPSARKPDGSIKLATPTVIEPPTRVEASPNPNINTIPNAPIKPPAAPAPAIEKAPEALPKGVSLETLAARELSKVKMAELPQAVRDILHPNTNWDNAGKMLEYLMANGDLTDSQAIGIVANAMWESAGVNPGQSQIGGPAFGLVQWEGGRRTALESYAAAQNKPAADLYVQLDFMLLELKRDAWNGYGELKQAKNSSDATLIFMRKFERPGIPHESGRLAMSKVVTDLYNSKWYALEKIAKDAATAGAGENTKTIGQPDREKKATANWVKPITDGVINSHYGDRGGVHHDGIDFPAAIGTDFRAVEDGVVVELLMDDVTGKQWCIAALEGIQYYGPLPDPVQKTVKVKHVIGDSVYISRYDHLSEFSVEVGQVVKAGQPLGKTGSSGCSTGGHAHFGMQKDGVSIDPELLYK